MNKNTKYTELYRRFELAVRKKGFLSIKEYEDSLESDQFKQGQIRICRIIRNYIEHENQDFVEASDNMISFLEKLTGELDDEEIPVKKKMISIRNAVRDSDLLVVAADFMIKKKANLIPVFDQKDFAVGTLSYEEIVRCVSSGNFTKAKKVASVQTTHKFGFINESTPMKQVYPIIKEHKKVFLILNDSKKVVGWIV